MLSFLLWRNTFYQNVCVFARVSVGLGVVEVYGQLLWLQANKYSSNYNYIESPWCGLV